MKRLLTDIKKHSLKFLVVGIVLLMFGPEIIAGAEFIAIVELIGVDVFLLMYLSIFLGFCCRLLDQWVYFERESCAGCFGNWALNASLYQNVVHFFIPERTLYYGFIFAVIATTVNFVFRMVTIV